jgi:hypothetical protein
MVDQQDKLSGIGHSLRPLGKLTHKVLEEVRHPQQFLNPERSKEIFMNGWVALVAAFRKIDSDIGRLQVRFELSMQETRTANGASFIYSGQDQTPLQCCVFPTDADVSYLPPIPEEQAKTFQGPPNCKFVITASTYFPGETPDGLRINIPELGYRGPECSAPFRDENPVLRPQYGAFYVDRGNVNIVDWSRLQELKETPFEDDQRLLMANSFVSSQNYTAACMTPEHQAREPYNFLGVAHRADGQAIYFHLGSNSFLYFLLSDPTGESAIPRANPSLFEIVAFINAIGKQRGWTDYALGGVEYDGGELNFPASYRCHRFQIAYGQPFDHQITPGDFLQKNFLDRI